MEAILATGDAPVADIIHFPRLVASTTSLDAFLEEGRRVKAKVIKTIIQGQQPYGSTEDPSLLHLPFYIAHTAHNQEGHSLLGRRWRYLDQATYRLSDHDFTQPLALFDLGLPRERLESYGRAAADYCAQAGFEARLFLDPPLVPGRMEVYRVSPEEIVDRTPVREPFLLVL